MWYYILEPHNILMFDTITTTHIAIGVFLLVALIVIAILAYNKFKHRFIDRLHRYLKETVATYQDIGITDFHGLPSLGKAELIHEHGYTFYFCCDPSLELSFIEGILICDLQADGFEIIKGHSGTVDIRFTADRGKSSYFVHVTSGTMSSKGLNTFRVHTEKSRAFC